MSSVEAHDEVELELLVAYLHLPQHAGPPTRAVLEGHVRSFAEREGFRLHRILAGADSPPDGDGAAVQADAAGVRDLIDCVQMDGVQKVLVVGSAKRALVALSRIRGVQILTLAQVRALNENPSSRAILAAHDVLVRSPIGGTVDE